MCKFDCAVYHCGHMTYTIRDTCHGYYVSTTTSDEHFETCSSFVTPKHLCAPPPNAIVNTQFYKNRICGRVDCGYKPENDPFCGPLDSPFEVGPPGTPKRKRKVRRSSTGSRAKRVRTQNVSPDWSDDDLPSSTPPVTALEPFEPDLLFRTWSTPPSLKRGKKPTPPVVRAPAVPAFVRDSNDPTPEPRYVHHGHATPHFHCIFQPNSFPGIPVEKASPSPRGVISTGGLKNIRTREGALGGAALLRVMLEGDGDDTPSRMAGNLAKLSLYDQAASEGGGKGRPGLAQGRLGLRRRIK